MIRIHRALSFNRIRLLIPFWAYSILLGFNVFQDALTEALTQSTESFFILMTGPSMSFVIYQSFLTITLSFYSKDLRSSLLYLSHPLGKREFVLSWLITSIYLPTLMYVLSYLASMFVLDPRRVLSITPLLIQTTPTLFYLSTIALLVTWRKLGPKTTLALSIFAFFVFPRLLSLLMIEMFVDFELLSIQYAGPFIPVKELLLYLIAAITVNGVTLALGRRIEL